MSARDDFLRATYGYAPRDINYRGTIGRGGSIDTKDYQAAVTKFIDKQSQQRAAAAQKAADDVRKQTEEQMKTMAKQYEDRLSASSETLAQAISRLAPGRTGAGTTPAVPGQLTARNLVGSTNLASQLNFQVTDEEILNDINNVRRQRLDSLISSGIANADDTARKIAAARASLASLSPSDKGYRAIEKTIKELEREYSDINSGLAEARQRITDFKPLSLADAEGVKSIQGFRDYVNQPLVNEAFVAQRQIEDLNTEIETSRRDLELAKGGFASTETSNNARIEEINKTNASLQAKLGRTKRAKDKAQISSQIQANNTQIETIRAETEAARSGVETAQRSYNLMQAGYDERLSAAQANVANLQQRASAGEVFDPGAASRQYLQQTRQALQLPEERALQQIAQIDPETLRTAGLLGEEYRRMAGRPIEETTTAQTEQLRQTIEQEALNQLRLGSTIGAEERRGYEQAIRAAQTARGNIFGLGPAVQEAAQLGRAGEERKLARYGAAQQFLASGETTGAALQRDIAFRDALARQRLGAAAGFIAGGPSIYNLAGQRTGQQQAGFQAYVQANQPAIGGFQTTQAQIPFYQTTRPEIPVQLAGQAASIYNQMQASQASMYGSQVGALASQPSGAQMFGQIAGGIGSILSPFKFG